MRRQPLFQIGVALAVLMLGSEASIAATPATTVTGVVDETAHSEAAVMAVDQHWMDAELDGDTAWLDAMLLPKFRSIGADGSVHPKAAIMAHAAKNRDSDVERRQVEAWLKAHPSGKSVVLHGDTAILSFYDPAKGATDDVRSSDIFVYVHGHWHALYSQHSGAKNH